MWYVKFSTTEKIKDSCKYPLKVIEAAQNKKQTKTGGLASLLDLKTGAKVMIAVHLDIQNRLMNGQVRKTADFSILIDRIILFI